MKLSLVACMLALTASASGCSWWSSHENTVVPPSTQFALCVVNDALAQKSVDQIVSDCGADAAAVIAALIASQDSKVELTSAYYEARVTIAKGRVR
jgi:hypothetical protein